MRPALGRCEEQRQRPPVVAPEHPVGEREPAGAGDRVQREQEEGLILAEADGDANRGGREQGDRQHGRDADDDHGEPGQNGEARERRRQPGRGADDQLELVRDEGQREHDLGGEQEHERDENVEPPAGEEQRGRGESTDNGRRLSELDTLHTLAGSLVAAVPAVSAGPGVVESDGPPK